MNTPKVSHHGTDRKTAAVVGVLFILGTVPALLSLPLMQDTVSAPDHLTAISTNAGQMIGFTAIKFFMGIACAGIGLALYPILKKYNQGLAIGSAGFRLIEGMTSVVGALLYVFLLALSQEFVKAGAPASSYFQTADAVINAGIGWFRDVAMLLTFGIGALMYYVVFYQYRLVPRWLSVWGLVGITLTIISAVLVMFNVIAPFSTIQVIFQMPILPQELVLAVWLIAKGFNPSALEGVFEPVLTGADYLTSLSANANQVTAGALLYIIGYFASAGIAVVMYPVLKKWNAGLALGSVVFRTIEAAFYMVGLVCLLSLLTLGQQFTTAGAADRTSLQAIGGSLVSVGDHAGLLAVFAFCLGAFMYYYLFFQSRLIPRWLSGFGIVAIILMTAACVLSLFSGNRITSYIPLAFPIFLQEMVLAVWLIARGFNPSAVASASAKVDMK